jgi:hypothetical protein
VGSQDRQKIVEQVVVVDTLAESLSVKPNTSSTEEAAKEDDDDDCSGLLGIADEVHARRPRVINDGIDSASESEGEGLPPPSLSTQLVAEESLPADEKAVPFPSCSPSIVKRPSFIPPGAASFVVRVPPQFPGLQYRSSKVLSERLPRYAKDGSMVHGFIEDEGAWLKVGEGHFLPIVVNGTRVLELVADATDDSPGASSPRHQREPSAVARPQILQDEGGFSSSFNDDPDFDGSGEETVPDEGPRAVPRTSSHHTMQSSSADWGPRPFLQNSPPKDSAAGLPPRISSGDRDEWTGPALLQVPAGDAEPCQEVQEVEPAEASEATDTASAVQRRIFADAHDDAAMSLLLRRVDPFGDPEPERLSHIKGCMRRSVCVPSCKRPVGQADDFSGIPAQKKAEGCSSKSMLPL